MCPMNAESGFLVDVDLTEVPDSPEWQPVPIVLPPALAVDMSNVPPPIDFTSPEPPPKRKRIKEEVKDAPLAKRKKLTNTPNDQ